MELLFVSLPSIVLVDIVLVGELTTCWLGSKLRQYRLDADTKLPLVLLFEEVMDTLSPHMLLLVPILSWLFNDISDPPVIPFDVEGSFSLFSLIDLTGLDGTACPMKNIIAY